MMNTETVKEEIVYFNEQVVYEAGNILIKRRDRQVDACSVDLFGRQCDVAACVQNRFDLYINGKQYYQQSQSNLHLLDADKQKEETDYSIGLLLKHYEKYGVDGRPKKSV